MKISKSYKLENAMSNDRVGRENLCSGEVTTASDGSRVAVAIDGHIMAVVPVEAESDELGALTPEVLKASRKLGLAMSLAEFDAKGHYELSNGVTLPRPKRGEDVGDLASFPNWEHVTRGSGGSGGPLTRAHTFKVSLSAELLYKLADAIGAKGVTLEFGDELSPILVRPIMFEDEEAPKAYGILMPIRTE
jgi:hypothetical protein